MANFKTIHTLYGLEKMAAAEATGTPINITHIAVGDGNGNEVFPSESQTMLVRERFRAAVNRVTQDPNDPTRFTAELIVPANVGGFVLREVGVYDDDGSLFVVGNLPDTYKPDDVEGAFADAVIRVEFLVTNATIVTIVADPNVVVATRQWIINNVTTCSLLPGGLVNQVLRKKSNACGDTEWADPTAVNVTVAAIEEEQTLAALQATVILNTVTTYGLAVYIEGIRLSKGAGLDQWQEAPPPNDVTRIVLGKSYPAGTTILLVQNEPNGASGAPLERANNLSDLLDLPLARLNLDVYSRAQTDALMPSGTVLYMARPTAPSGFLKANGAAVSRTAFAALFAVIGTTFGSGDGFTTFSLPDLRGEFLRGWDDGRNQDPGRGLGSLQLDETRAHSHTGSTATNGQHSHGGSTNTAGSHNHSGTTATAGDHAHFTHNLNASSINPNSSPLSETNTAARLGATGGESNYNIAGTTSTANGGLTSSAGSHSHAFGSNTAGDHAHTISTDLQGNHTHAFTTNATGGAETRPRNVALLAVIKF